MTKLANEMARLLWWYLLWLMRRPWVRRLQRLSLRLLGTKRRPRLWASIKKQNRFARRYGLPALSIAMNIVLASVTLTVFYLLVLDLYQAGAFQVPTSYRS